MLQHLKSTEVFEFECLDSAW